MDNMKINLVGYRDWAKNCFKAFPEHNSFQDNNSFIEYAEDCSGRQMFVFIGWSEIIPLRLIDQHLCICFHPSDLPDFRGGSPLQHQKIAGIEETKLTAFKMTNEIDAGPIIDKTPLNIFGHLDEVFANLTLASIRLLQKILTNIWDEEYLAGIEQEHYKATYYKRRKPKDSEITIGDLQNKTGKELFEFICGLEDPYPNAYITTIDGRKIIFKRVDLE